VGRSSKEQADANHERIVDAAGRLFRSRGYDTVGIADVMKAAGMTQGGFYKHFSSKEALAAEAWATGFDQAAVLWREQCGAASPVASVIEYYLSPKSSEYNCPMVAHGEEAARTEEGSDLRRVYVAGARSLYETFMRKAEGTTDENCAKLLFAAMVGANLLSRFGHENNEQWIEGLKTAVMDAAKVSTATESLDHSVSTERPKILKRKTSKRKIGK
jgi:TetR/AcrR family transcriptional regulator, transcriptional repressor for nem operon